MLLKNYQTSTLNTLKDFFENCRIMGHVEAYKKITNDPEISHRLGAYKSDYIVWDALPNTPRVCLQIPTGGGKTIVAAHALKITSEVWLERDYPVVLWFTPSDSIRRQTVEALKNPRHPYREALDEQFKGNVKVFDLDEKFNIRPSDIDNNTCIIVSTIQSFRQTNTDKYSVYKHNENLEPHFTHIKANDKMELDSETNKLKFSFANLLNYHNPIIIADEAHGAVTDLTEDLQSRINPSAVIELTATPILKNNTLYSVKASELKEEEMIKLPISLVEHNNWGLAITEAIARRSELEKAAQHEKEYIRPIILFQAQNVNQEVNTETLKKHLIDNMDIPENEIAIVTSEQKELDDINIFDKNCPIRYIITVEALKEGWDCSFAYVLCSLANVKSDTSIIQLLGRVMRMPYAKSRKIASLNKAYAYVVSDRFGEAAEALVDKLSKKGFGKEEAPSIIIQEPIDFGLFSSQIKSYETKISSKISIEDVPDNFETLKEKDGTTIIKITEKTTEEDLEKIKPILNTEEIFYLKNNFEAFKKEMSISSPVKDGETFLVPKMMFHAQGEIVFAEPDLIFEQVEWDISEYAPYRLDANEFNIEKQGRGYIIDIDGQKLTHSYSGDAQISMAFVDVDNWTDITLISWLDKTLRQDDISQPQMINWLRKIVEYLTKDRNITISELMIAKYALARKLEQKIKDARLKAQKRAVQINLLDDTTANVVVNDEFNFEFYDGMYDGEIPYQGSYKFTKYFLGSNKVSQFDGKEEEECARALDMNKNIKCWIRNVARHKNSFRLPTSTDNFYPDFIAKLNDGRILAVEYKGEHLIDNEDTREKNTIGALWERKSKGKCLFMIAQKRKDGLNIYEQIDLKTGVL